MLFRPARSHYAWPDRPVSDTTLRAFWDPVKLGPTSGFGPLLAAIVGYRLDRGSQFGPCPDRHSAALRDAGLQAAYLIVASRALGLHCGPIWDFKAKLADAAFFPEGMVVNFVCAIGYGEGSPFSAPEMPPGIAAACNIL